MASQLRGWIRADSTLSYWLSQSEQAIRSCYRDWSRDEYLTYLRQNLKKTAFEFCVFSNQEVVVPSRPTMRSGLESYSCSSPLQGAAIAYISGLPYCLSSCWGEPLGEPGQNTKEREKSWVRVFLVLASLVGGCHRLRVSTTKGHRFCWAGPCSGFRELPSPRPSGLGLDSTSLFLGPGYCTVPCCYPIPCPTVLLGNLPHSSQRGRTMHFLRP